MYSEAASCTAKRAKSGSEPSQLRVGIVTHPALCQKLVCRCNAWKGINKTMPVLTDTGVRRLCNCGLRSGRLRVCAIAGSAFAACDLTGSAFAVWQALHLCVCDLADPAFSLWQALRCLAGAPWRALPFVLKGPAFPISEALLVRIRYATGVVFPVFQTIRCSSAGSYSGSLHSAHDGRPHTRSAVAVGIVRCIVRLEELLFWKLCGKNNCTGKKKVAGGETIIST